jgi:hypothetical protein
MNEDNYKHSHEIVELALLKHGYTDLDKFLFVDKSFDDAFDESKRSVKILMIVLYDENEEKQFNFCKELVSSEFIMELSRQNFILWFGNINNASQMQTLKSILSRHPNLMDMEDRVYPITSLVSYLDNSLSVIDTIEGPVDIDVMISKLLNVVEIYMPLLENQREGRLQKENETQQFISEQDRLYEEALRKDQERERRNRELEEQRALEEILEKSRQEELERKLALRRQNLPAEPPKDSRAITTIKFRLPDNNVIIRRFNCSDPIKALFDYLAVEHKIDSDQIILVSNFPRLTLEYSKTGEETIENIKLFPQGALHVQFR